MQMSGSKNILKRLDYDKKLRLWRLSFCLQYMTVMSFLEFLTVGTSALHSKARSMFGMD